MPPGSQTGRARYRRNPQREEPRASSLSGTLEGVGAPKAPLSLFDGHDAGLWATRRATYRCPSDLRAKRLVGLGSQPRHQTQRHFLGSRPELSGFTPWLSFADSPRAGPPRATRSRRRTPPARFVQPFAGRVEVLAQRDVWVQRPSEQQNHRSIQTTQEPCGTDGARGKSSQFLSQMT